MHTTSRSKTFDTSLPVHLTKLMAGFFLFLISFFLLPYPISAQVQEWENQESGVATIKSAETLFTNLLSLAIQLIGITTFIIIVVGGIKYLLSGGDPKATEAAQATITKGVIGLVLAVTSWFILQAIAGFTGVESILEFQIGLN